MHFRQERMPVFLKKFKERGFSDRTLLFAGCLVFILFSAAFYKERIIFTDTVVGIMDLMKQNKLTVSTNRYTSIFGQILPLIFYRLHAPLTILVFLYSLNLALIPVVFIVISVFWFKQTKTGWSILLFYTLMSARSFYFPISEFQVGLCFLLFYTGALEHFIKGIMKPVSFWALSLFFVPTIVFSHPLSFYVMTAWLILEWCLFMRHKKTFVIVAGFMLLSFIAKSILFQIPYEAEKSQGLEHFKDPGLQILNTVLASSFFKAIKDDYFLLPILFILAFAAFLKQRKYLAAVLFPLIVSAFWMLITVSFKDRSYSYYFEHMYQPLAFFIAFAAGYYVKEFLSRRLWIPAILLISGISFTKIYNGKEPFQQRLSWYAKIFKLMDAKGIKKTFIENSSVSLSHEPESYWTDFYETLVLSAMEGRENTKTITIVWNIEDARKYTGVSDVLFNVAFYPHPIREFPAEYFQIGDESYIILRDVFSVEEIRKLSYSQP